MALDVVHTPIPPAALREYLGMLDARGETYEFLVNSTATSASLSLGLCREGCEDAMTVTLNMDGTWTAAHVLVVGEAR